MKKVKEHETRGLSSKYSWERNTILSNNEEYIAKVHEKMGLVMKKNRKMEALKIMKEIQAISKNFTLDAIYSQKEKTSASILDANF